MAKAPSKLSDTTRAMLTLAATRLDRLVRPPQLPAAAARQEGGFLSSWLAQPGEPDVASAKVASIVAEHVARGNPAGCR